MNSNLLNSTISRPQQQINSQLMPTEQSFPVLDPTDFRVLHRTSHSPFQLQQQQQQQLQQLQQQLRNNGFQNAPASAPILNSASMQSLILQFANSVSSSSNSLANSASAANMLMMMNSSNNNTNNTNNNLAQLSSSYMLHQQNSNQSGSVKMWSNFNPNKDLRLKNPQLDSQQQEFQIQQEDFPALPRPQSVNNKSDSQTNLNINSTDQNFQISSTNLTESDLNSPTGLVNSSSSTSLTNKPLNINQNITNTQNIQNQAQQQTAPSSATTTTTTTGKKGIIISPDGRIKNVPPNMLLDQFGIVGLLAYLRSADREKDNYTLALGTDLTTLGLNLNSNENLYHSFLSPFSDSPCRLQDIDFPVPTEYIINFQIKDKLAPIDLTRYHEDTLFYLFYMNGGDLIQLQAAGALFDHDWRYHTEKRVWLTKVPGLEPHQKDGSFERGIYTLFDVSQWRKVQMEMSIEYSKLAEKPQLSQILLQQQQQLAQSSNPSTSNLPSFLQQQLQHQAFSA
ncbi:unnamed protein product, partial [Brachionus calyciflorus]